MVANDAGDRVTPAVVAFTENEEVRPRSAAGREGLCLGLTCSFSVFHSGCGLSCKAEQNKERFQHCGESKADPGEEVSGSGAGGCVSQLVSAAFLSGSVSVWLWEVFFSKAM